MSDNQQKNKINNQQKQTNNPKAQANMRDSGKNVKPTSVNVKKNAVPQNRNQNVAQAQHKNQVVAKQQNKNQPIKVEAQTNKGANNQKNSHSSQHLNKVENQQNRKANIEKNRGENRVENRRESEVERRNENKNNSEKARLDKELMISNESLFSEFRSFKQQDKNYGNMNDDVEVDFSFLKQSKVEATKGTFAEQKIAESLLRRESNCDHGCGKNGTCGTGGCGTANIVNLMINDFEYNDTRRIIEVEFRGSRREFVYVSDSDVRLKSMDRVVVEIEKGLEFGIVKMTGSLVHAKRKSKKTANEPLSRFVRKATEEDLKSYTELKAAEKADRTRCQERVRYFNLEMNLFDVEWQFDRKKITFFYTAEGRVDFRELVKDLANIFKARIELRQVPPRDEAKRLGQIGICGKELCCTTHLGRYEHITLEHVNYQMLQPNPQKLSGQCGRLKCCLLYEVDTYVEGLKKFPKLDAQIRTDRGECVIQKLDIFKNLIYLHYLKTDEWEVIELADFKKEKGYLVLN